MTGLFKECSDQWKYLKKCNISEVFKFCLIVSKSVRLEGEDMWRKYTGLFENSDHTVTDKFQIRENF